jgi:ketosteroid isomerase-like protein
VIDVQAAARRWADTWERAWPAADLESIASLYAPDVLFSSLPFRGLQAPAEYVAWAFAAQSKAECRFGDPIVSGDRAAVEWWGVVTDDDGRIETLAGTSMLRFGASGQVVEQRDVWASESGRRELPHWPR